MTSPDVYLDRITIMRNVTLPALIKHEKTGKNTITRIIAHETVIKPSSIEIGDGYLVLMDDERPICIIQNGKTFPGNYTRVLGMDKKPTIAELYTQELSWVKHIQLSEDFDPENIRDSWANVFNFKEEDLSVPIFGLRKPQIAAIFSALSHWKVGEETGTVVMPTGTGKTETMLSLLIANRCKKLLVIVPTDPLREQIAEKFISLGYLQKLEFGIVSENAKKPIVGIINENYKKIEELGTFLNKCNVVITTMDMVTSGSLEMQKYLAETVSHVFIDEAHHAKAPSWFRFLDLCIPIKVLQFTATPFRNDGQSLDGKFIFNYSLKKAQEDGYFKNIELIQVNEWDNAKSDRVIAEAAVARLKQDRQQYDHILMARCSKQARANTVFEIYKQYQEYQPVVIHRGLSDRDRRAAKEKILNKEAKIIVCVDMLGEGFDLPNLKIAAFHDIRQSLPITVQIAGRFTRTKFDEQLGNASIVVNLKDADVPKELEEFYALGADWNTILPRVSTSRIKKEVDFSEFLNGFADLDASKIPFQSLKPALSTVVYKNHSEGWFPTNYEQGLAKADDLDYLFPSLNADKKTLIIITGKKQSIDWGYSKEIYEILWNLYVIHWDTKRNLLFINGSDNAGVYPELAHAIIGDDAELINKINIFKAFHDIERVRLQNVGLKEFLGRNKSFSMHTGFDIEKALDMADKEGSEKAFVAGSGYENGTKVSIGCSYKGRIWSHAKGDIQELIDWCTSVGKKLIRDDIDPNTILKETLIPNSISLRPVITPFAIDWDEAVFLEPETRINIVINNKEYPFYQTELELVQPSENGDLLFELVTPNDRIRFRQVLFSNNGKFDDFYIENITPAFGQVLIHKGRKQYKFESFLHQNPVNWLFVDGSSLSGNNYVELKQLIPAYPKEQILSRLWNGVNLSKEAQKIDPKVTESIQYALIQELKEGDFDLIYDDDYSGEIADIITVKQFDDYINIQLYHLKYAKSGQVSQRIDDLYEVCGQAMKSINWKFKESKEFFEHLLRREIKSRKGKSCSRIELGTKDTIVFLKDIVRKDYPVEFEMFIVQPGLSASNPSPDQLTLLGVTSSYLSSKGCMELTVIGSA